MVEADHRRGAGEVAERVGGRVAAHIVHRALTMLDDHLHPREAACLALDSPCCARSRIRFKRMRGRSLGSALAALLVEEPVSVVVGADDPVAGGIARTECPIPRWSLSTRRGEIVAAPALPRPRWWVACGLVAAMALLAAAKPAAVIRVLPRLASVYALAGAPVNLRGLAFDHVTARFQDAAGTRFLVVEGIIRNVAREARKPAKLRVVVTGADGRALYRWTAHSGIASLEPGQVAPFRARLAAPPTEAQGVTVDFAPREGSSAAGN
jgi:hypothetical protein